MHKYEKGMKDLCLKLPWIMKTKVSFYTLPTFFVGRSRGLPENSWKIHGFPWVPMGSHGVPMASMENPRMSEIKILMKTTIR